MQLLGKFRDDQTAKNIILDLAQQKKQVVYGAQATNIQLPPHLRKKTRDYDILTKDPKKAAMELAKKLNEEFGKGSFEVVPAKHKKTIKVKSKDGKTIADYTLTTKKPATKKILGINYATLKYASKKIKKILKDEASKFRFDKDRDTLARIKAGEMRW